MELITKVTDITDTMTRFVMKQEINYARVLPQN